MGTASRHKFGRRGSRPTYSRGKSSLGTGRSGGHESGGEDEGAYEPLSHVVVDNDFEQFVPAATTKSDSGSTGGGTREQREDGEKRLVQLADGVDVGLSSCLSWTELCVGGKLIK